MAKLNPVLEEPENCSVRPPKEEWLANGLIENSLDRPQGLIECDTVLDIGSGIRPMQWYKPKTHICVEGYRTYCEKLSEAGFQVVHEEAQAYLRDMELDLETVEAIYLLDVIEHMHKLEGEEVVKLAQGVATKQVIIYTPFG